MTKEELVILFFSIENEDRVKEAKEYIFNQLDVLDIIKKNHDIYFYEGRCPYCNY